MARKTGSEYSTPLGPATSKSQGKLKLTFRVDQYGGTITDDDRNDAPVLNAKGEDIVDAQKGTVLGRSDNKSRTRCCCGGGPENYVGTIDQIKRQDQHVTIKAKSRGRKSKYRLYLGDDQIGEMKGNSKELKVELDGTKVAKINYKPKFANSFAGTFKIEILEPGVDVAFICLLCFSVREFHLANSRTRTITYW